MARQRLKKVVRESERERVCQIHGRRGLSIKERRSDGRDLPGAEGDAGESKVREAAPTAAWVWVFLIQRVCFKE